ncbi:hypothetical protein D3C73_1314320 [compost metagenome]
MVLAERDHHIVAFDCGFLKRNERFRTAEKTCLDGHPGRFTRVIVGVKRADGAHLVTFSGADVSVEAHQTVNVFPREHDVSLECGSLTVECQAGCITGRGFRMPERGASFNPSTLRNTNTVSMLSVCLASPNYGERVALATLPAGP